MSRMDWLSAITRNTRDRGPSLLLD